MPHEGLKVGRARRKSVRDLQEPFGKDFNKYVAEIVTNSDDSYKRLEQNGTLDLNKLKTIEIVIVNDKQSNGYKVIITDQAEGLTKERIEEIFTKYGGDNAGGSVVKSRGIFGQGASDVLFNSAYNGFPAMIETIKCGIPTKTRFYLDDNLDRYIDPEELNLSKQQLIQLRKSWGIEENGTRVTFGVKEDVLGKNADRVVRDLQNFYSFRYIFSSPNREVSFSYRKNRYILDSSEYTFKESERILSDKKFQFKHDNFTLNGLLNLYKVDREPHDRTTIIVRDENYVVYANDFFRFDNNPKAKSICGELVLDKLYEVCKFYLNSEDNASAVLTETRDGFDQTHSFYKDLFKAVSPIILNTVEKFGKTIKETDITNNKKFSDALRDINKYLEKEIEEEIDGPRPGIEPPSNGLRFARPEIFVNKGKNYTIPLYINPKMISGDEEINLIFQHNNSIKLAPVSFSYGEPEKREDLVIKNVGIQTREITSEAITVKAKSSIYEANLLVNVIERDMFYPQNGMEFHSDIMRVKPEELHNAKLYVDTTIIPVGSKIKINNEESNIIFMSESMMVKEEHIIADEIAMLKVQYVPKVDEGDYFITAKFGEFEARLDIQVRIGKDPNPGTRGLINGFKLLPGDEYYQSYFQPFEKVIYILQDNLINKTLMPDISNRDPEKPNFSKGERIVIADILANEIAILLVNKQIEKGKIAIEVNGQEQYLNKIRQEKNKIFEIMHKVIE